MLCLAIKLEPNSRSLDIPNKLLTVCLYPRFIISPNVRKDLTILVEGLTFLYNYLNPKQRNVYYRESK